VSFLEDRIHHLAPNSRQVIVLLKQAVIFTDLHGMYLQKDVKYIDWTAINCLSVWVNLVEPVNTGFVD